jgi:hypothetical protein
MVSVGKEVYVLKKSPLCDPMINGAVRDNPAAVSIGNGNLEREVCPVREKKKLEACNRNI